MRGYLLDTNVLSEVTKRSPSERVIARLREVPAESLHASAISVMELRFGAARHARGEALWARLEREVLSRVTVLPVDREVGIRAGEVLATLAARGEPIGTEDVLIAATALVHGLGVASRNVRHLARVDGLVVESWWAP